MKWLLRGALVVLNAGLALACFATSDPGRSSVATVPFAAASLASVLPSSASMLAAVAPRLVAETPSVRSRWSQPVWHPGDLSAIEALDGRPTATAKAPPKVRAPSAIVADLDRGEILWARDADAPRTIASITKLFAALALAADEPDLDASHCLTWEQWPSRPGARSKFETGSCSTGWEYLGAALVASDNRGAFAFPAIAGQDYFRFVERMNAVAADIGASGASFVDPAGLEDENVATARDVLKAVFAVSAHPDLSIPASADGWRLETDRGNRLLGTTNRLDGRYDTLAAKTGYTDTAHYCFATVVRTRQGRTLAAVVLGAPTNATRFADVRALVDWADAL